MRGIITFLPLYRFVTLKMFARFFKPKWQHRNPAKRREAVAHLAANDPALLTLAREDDVPEVRTEAISRLIDIEALREIAQSERDRHVLQYAITRLQDMLCGSVEDAPPLSERLRFLDHCNSDLVGHIARYGNEAELRRRAIALLKKPELLTEIALQDQTSEVRLEATKCIDNIEMLNRVVKESKKNDKRVAQLARQRLAQLRKRKATYEQLAALTDELEGLCVQGSHTVRQSLLLKAERARSELSEEIDDEGLELFDSAYMHLNQLCDRYRSLKASKQRACQILEKIAHDLDREEELTDELERRIQVPLAEANECWNTEGTLEDGDQKVLTQRYRQFAERVIEQQNRLHENALAAQKIREFLHKAEIAADHGRYATKQSIEMVLNAWEKLPKPDTVSLSQALTARFQQLHDRIEQTRAQVAEQVRQAEQVLTELTARLDEAVAGGQLNEAISLRDQIRHRLDHTAGLATDKRRNFERRLKLAAPKMRELQSWRKWGASGVRERFCEQAEGLLDSEQSPHELAQQIRELRAAWKRLDRQTGPASEAIWRRFNLACNRAYEPCQTAFAEEATQREHSLSKKLKLCEELEKITATTDWDDVDWRALVKSYNNLQQAWHKAGPVNRAQNRDITKRFKKAKRTIEDRLEKQRQAGLRYRKQLIDRVQRLAEEPDLTKAIEQVKRAQADWNTVVVRATRRTEQEIWKGFRAACDEVFERRDAETQARRQALADNAAKKSELCDELETHTQHLVQDNLHETAQSVERIKQAWSEIGDLPSSVRPSLGKRFQDALNAFNSAVREIQRQRAQQVWNVLQERAHLCAQLEALLEKPEDSAQISALQSMWTAMPELEEALITGVQARFERALSILLADDSSARDTAVRHLRSAAEEKQLQCLEMEVIAGIDSPPEYREQRMRLKVNQLSERFGGQDGHNSKASYEIVLDAQQQWVQSGMLPAEEMHALEQRFNAAAKIMLAAK